MTTSFSKNGRKVLKFCTSALVEILYRLVIRKSRPRNTPTQNDVFWDLKNAPFNFDETLPKYAEFCLVSETIVEKCSKSLIRGFSLIRSRKIWKFTDKVLPFDSVGQNWQLSKITHQIYFTDKGLISKKKFRNVIRPWKQYMTFTKFCHNMQNFV